MGNVKRANMLRTFIIFILITASPLSAGLEKAEKAMQIHAELMNIWEKSFTNTENPELKKQLLAKRPEARKTSKILMKEITLLLDEPEALEPITWIYKNDPAFLNSTEDNSPGALIRNKLQRIHYKNKGAGLLSVTISQFAFSPKELPFLEKVAAKSPIAEERGYAALALSIALSNIGDEPEVIAKRLTHLKTAIELTPEDSTSEDLDVNEIISNQLYVIQNLTKGRTPPKFSGADAVGKEILLTGEEQKVTALIFWTDASPPALLPILNNMHALLEKVGGRAIGIYAGTPETLRSLNQQFPIKWDNIYDAKGDIFTKYRINKAPVVFLLDKKGSIQTIGEPNALINLSIQALAE